MHVFSGTVGSRSIKSIFSWTKPHQVYLHISRGLKFDLKTNKQKYHKYHKRFYFDVYDSKSNVSKIIWFWFSGERYSPCRIPNMTAKPIHGKWSKFVFRIPPNKPGNLKILHECPRLVPLVRHTGLET